MRGRVKIFLTIGIELTILVVVLLFVSRQLNTLQFGRGDTALIVWAYFFSIILALDSLFYIALRFIINSKQKNVLLYLVGGLLIIGSISFGVFAWLNSTGSFKGISILFFTPLILLTLRYLFLKFLARK